MRKHLVTVEMKTSFLTGRYFHLLWGEGRTEGTEWNN